MAANWLVATTMGSRRTAVRVTLGSDLFEQLEPFPTCAEFETCAGHEWGAQLPAIAAALRTLPVRSVILDGEGVICGPDGVSDFDRMRAVFSRKGSPDVFLYADARWDSIPGSGSANREGYHPPS